MLIVSQICKAFFHRMSLSKNMNQTHVSPDSIVHFYSLANIEDIEQIAYRYPRSKEYTLILNIGFIMINKGLKGAEAAVGLCTGSNSKN